MLSNLKTSTKVVAGFGAMLSILATLGVISYVMFGRVDSNVSGLADQQQALTFAGVEFLDEAGCADVGERDGTICAGEVGGEFRELTMLVALGDAGGSGERASTSAELAIAARDAMFAGSGNGAPAGTGT